MNKSNSQKHKQNVVFFIGAGFTKAIVNTAPIGTEFFLNAFDPHNSFIGDERIKDVKKFIDNNYYQLKDNHYPNIEDVLSLIDYTIERKEALSEVYLFEEVVNVRNKIIYLMGKVIKDNIEKSSEQKKEVSRSFIEKINNLLLKSKKVSIISTNYDIIIDNALREKIQSCNYGEMLRYNIFLDINGPKRNARPTTTLNWEDPNISCRGEINEGGIPLLKIHGSLNWFYCPKCDEVDITVGTKQADDFVEQQRRSLCANPMCTSTYEPLLVTPTMLKVYNNTFLQKLWTHSEKIISESNEIVFIGYSLPEADYHIRSLLTKALIKNTNNIRILVIEKKPLNDEDAERIEAVGDRYNTLFGQDRVTFKPIGLEGMLVQWDALIEE